jgi:hypothetical protein
LLTIVAVFLKCYLIVFDAANRQPASDRWRWFLVSLGARWFNTKFKKLHDNSNFWGSDGWSIHGRPVTRDAS